MKNRLGIGISVLTVSLAIPAEFTVLTLKLSASRLAILVFLIPALLRYIKDEGSLRLQMFDLIAITYGVWISISLLYNEGSGGLILAGVTNLEFLGAYFIVRSSLTNIDLIKRWTRLHLFIVAALLPLAAIESIYNINALQIAFGAIFDTFERPASSYPRLGLNRSMTGFDHPILYGLFSVVLFSIQFGTVAGIGGKVWTFLLIFSSAFFSLSSGPMLGLIVQVGLIAILKVPKIGWRVILLVFALLYSILEIASSRPIITIFFQFAFDPGTAWTRYIVLQHGMESVWSNPIFGIGTSDWIRPSWLVRSVDNYWLVTAMVYGIPGFILHALFVLALVLAVARSQDTKSVHAYVSGQYLICIAALIVVLFTVHVWGAMASLVGMVFALGGCLTCTSDNPESESMESVLRTSPSYTRYRIDKNKS